MLFTPHAIAGAAMGIAAGDPYLGFALSYAGHHALDSLPHFDQGTFYTAKMGAEYLGIPAKYGLAKKFSRRDWLMLFADVAFAAVFAVIIVVAKADSPTFLILAAAGAAGGLMPDFIGSNPLWSRKLEARFWIFKKYRAFHAYFHCTVTRPYIWLGVATQLVVLAISFLYLLS